MRLSARAPPSSRAARLLWAIRMQRAGILCIAISMCLALTVVTRFAIGTGWATATLTVLVVVIVGAWFVIPRSASESSD